MKTKFVKHCGFHNVMLTTLRFANARDFETRAVALVKKMKHNDRWGVKVGRDEMVVSFSDYATGAILTLWRAPCAPRLILKGGAK